MKKRLFLTGAFVIVTMTNAIWNFNRSNNETSLSELALTNVEALASNETGGTGENNKIITDEIKSMEILSYGIRTTYYRHCSMGGSQYCTSGTWSDFTPR